MGEEKKNSFINRLFTISYQPENSNNILTTGVKYKPNIRGKVEEYICQGIRFYLVYQVKLEKYDADEEEETQDAYFHGGNRRIIDIEQFDELYDEEWIR